MLDKPISPLRQRMIDDMTARRFNEHTQRDYVRNVRTFAAFLGRSPDTATQSSLRISTFAAAPAARANGARATAR